MKRLYFLALISLCLCGLSVVVSATDLPHDFESQLTPDCYFEMNDGIVSYFEYSGNDDFEENLLFGVAQSTANSGERLGAYLRYNQVGTDGTNKNVYVLAGVLDINPADNKYANLWVRPFWSFTGTSVRIAYWQFYENPTDPVSKYKYRVGSIGYNMLYDSSGSSVVPGMENIDFRSMNFYGYGDTLPGTWYQNALYQIPDSATTSNAYWYSAARSVLVSVDDSLSKVDTTNKDLDASLSGSKSDLDSLGGSIHSEQSEALDKANTGRLNASSFGRGEVATVKSLDAYKDWSTVMGALLTTNYDSSFNLSKLMIFLICVATVSTVFLGSKRG